MGEEQGRRSTAGLVLEVDLRHGLSVRRRLPSSSIRWMDAQSAVERELRSRSKFAAVRRVPSLHARTQQLEPPPAPRLRRRK